MKEVGAGMADDNYITHKKGLRESFLDELTDSHAVNKTEAGGRVMSATQSAGVTPFLPSEVSTVRKLNEPPLMKVESSGRGAS